MSSSSSSTRTQQMSAGPRSLLKKQVAGAAQLKHVRFAVAATTPTTKVDVRTDMITTIESDASMPASVVSQQCQQQQHRQQQVQKRQTQQHIDATKLNKKRARPNELSVRVHQAHAEATQALYHVEKERERQHKRVILATERLSQMAEALHTSQFVVPQLIRELEQMADVAERRQAESCAQAETFIARLSEQRRRLEDVRNRYETSEELVLRALDCDLLEEDNLQCAIEALQQLDVSRQAVNEFLQEVSSTTREC